MSGQDDRSGDADASMTIIEVVCTAKGGHDPLKLGKLVVTDRGDKWNVQIRPGVEDVLQDEHAAVRIQYDFDSHRGMVQLTCPRQRCRQNRRRSLHEWAQVALRWLEVGGESRPLDLSEMP